MENWQYLQHLHFLRPHWLWLIIPVLALAWWLLKKYHQAPKNQAIESWQVHVDSHLLPYLLVGGLDGKGLDGKDLDGQGLAGKNTDSNNSLNNNLSNQLANKLKTKLTHLAIYLSLIAMIVGISAPTWQQKPVPAVQASTPTMMVLSLAQSMNADDIKPTRLKRAVHKIRDILRQTEGEQRGLVIYSDMAFTASPLTNDHKVIQQMLPELSTGLMPVLGNRLDLAINEASELLQRGGASAYTNGGNIIVLTDGVGDDPSKSLQAVKRAKQLGYTVSILGIGTEKGADMTVADGRKVGDGKGNIQQTKLNPKQLAQLAKAGGGLFRTITPSDKDIQALLDNATNASNPLITSKANTATKANADINQWVDMGYWFLLIPLLLMPFAFRRGVLGKL